MSPDGSRRSEPKGQQFAQAHVEPEAVALPYETDYDRQELEDSDLLNIRPLPRPPQSGHTSPRTERPPRLATLDVERADETTGEDEGEGTLKAQQWASVFNVLDSEKERTDGDTLKPIRSNSNATDSALSVSSEASSRTAMPPSVGDVDMQPEDSGTISSVASFPSFDDDDDSEAGTWAKPLDSDAASPFPKAAEEDAPNETEQTLRPDAISLHDPGSVGGAPLVAQISSPRRPELRLTIDPPRSGPPSRSTSPRPRPSPRLKTINTITPLGQPSPGIGRSNSFARRDNDWAFRPPPEQLYDNLDDFFPKHDLDKPVLDASGAPGSPLVASPKTETTSPAQVIAAAAAASASGAFPQRARHKKSIRIVAQDRKRFLERAEQADARRAQGQGAALSRRRSTKLWGTKVVEMTPGQEQITPSSAASTESPSSETGTKRE